MRNLSVTVLGVIPAFSLCYFILPISIYAVGEYLDTGESGILLMFLWCVLAVFGTFALFFSIESAPGPVRMVGLACGIAAMYGLDGFNYIGPSLWSLFFIGPIVIAIFLIFEGLYAISTTGDDSDDWMN